MKIYNLNEASGEEIQELLDKIDDLGPATQEKDGTMSRQDKSKLDNDVPYRALTNLEIEAILNS